MRQWSEPGANDLRWRGPRRSLEDLAVLHECWSEWLPKFPWALYATLTLGDRPITSNGVRSYLGQYVCWISKVAGLPTYCFWANEYGEKTGRLHTHLLLGNVGALKADCGHRAEDDQGQKCCVKHAWPLGWTRVYPIHTDQPARDLAYYVSKYVTKANGEWDLIGLPNRSQEILSVCTARAQLPAGD